MTPMTLVIQIRKIYYSKSFYIKIIFPKCFIIGILLKKCVCSPIHSLPTQWYSYLCYGSNTMVSGCASVAMSRHSKVGKSKMKKMVLFSTHCIVT